MPQYPTGYNPLDAVAAGGVSDVRLTDPLTGAGLMTTNLDPNVVGVDPLTGEDAPAGTDVLFGSAARSYIATGLVNGDFNVPPPFPDRPLNGIPELVDYNPLPGWKYVQTGSAVTARWENGAIVFSVAAGAGTGDSAYIEQDAHVSQKGRNGTVHIPSAQFTEYPIDDLVILEAQYLDADGNTTGALADTWDFTDRTYTVGANGEAGMPSDAVRLRVRIGMQDDFSDAAEWHLEHAWLDERFALGGGIYYSDWATANRDITEDISSASMYVVSSLGGANRTLRSISSTGVRFGRVLWLYNADNTNSIILSHNNATPALADRIFCPNNADLTLRPRAGVMLMYFEGIIDSGGRWRVMTQV